MGKPKYEHLTHGIDPEQLRAVAHRIGIAAADPTTAAAAARIAKARKPVPAEPENGPTEDA